eukprot:10214686-Prorocentrum_lima.AAC.1
MTSSLVGSEMCIRDRVIERGVQQAEVTSHKTWVLQTFGSTGARGAFVPVSYTHLTLPTICSV